MAMYFLFHLISYVLSYNLNEGLFDLINESWSNAIVYLSFIINGYLSFSYLISCLNGHVLFI